jgi:hypothetical protein
MGNCFENDSDWERRLMLFDCCDRIISQQTAFPPYPAVGKTDSSVMELEAKGPET